jgi:hypothetical protein
MIQTPRRVPALLLLCSILLVSACQTSTSGSGRESFMGGMRDTAAKNASDADRPAATPRRAPEKPAAADGPRTTAAPAPRPEPGPAIPDTRVMLYQPKGDLLLILVNEGHSGRSTEEGRTNLALGELNRAYKVLTDTQMTALLKSLAAAGYDAGAEEFVKGDEQYLGKAAGDLPRYQGIISIERGPGKTKVLGFRKSSESDALGLRRYETYVRLKTLVQKWFADTSRDEYPVGGVTVPGPK